MKSLSLEQRKFMEQLANLGKSVLPKGASLWLYGSQARGEATENSDWDLLILLNKEKREFSDLGRYVSPFTEMGFANNEYVMPVIYTRSEWASMYFMPFAKNVEQDKIVLV